MVKKLLFIGFVFLTFLTFAQNVESVSISQKNQLPIGKTITDITAFPNPLTSKSIISFHSTIEQNVIFEVKNVLGNSVFKQKFLAEEGTNELSFNRENLTSGMYIYTIQTNAEIISKRLVIR